MVRTEQETKNPSKSLRLGNHLLSRWAAGKLRSFLMAKELMEKNGSQLVFYSQKNAGTKNTTDFRQLVMALLFNIISGDVVGM